MSYKSSSIIDFVATLATATAATLARTVKPAAEGTGGSLASSA